VGRSETSYLVLDIETVPDDVLWVAPDPCLGGPDRSFPPAYAHRIICLGSMWLGPDYGLRQLEILGDGLEEGAILERFSRFVAEHRPALITFNGRTFDLPVIALRALRCGVAMGWYYRDRALRHRYSEDGHIDLCDQLADHGAARAASLDALARLIGLPGKIGIDGSQVEALHRAGLLDQIQNYCLSDVAQTALLFLRFRLLQGVLDPPSYVAAVRDLTGALASDARVSELCQAIDGGRLLSAA
jgi:predicted PolB exonuclease-like 3'-5' exonuclease